MKKTYHWGIIGLGKIAHKFAQDLAGLPNARLWAVASRSAERAASFAGQYEAPHHYGNYEEILSCPDLDVVYIATPHTSHCELTVMCLQAGIPVLCEKPFAMNAEEVDRMIQTAREHDTFLMEALWTRFFPTIRETLELIHSGQIGRVLGVKADFGFQASFNPESRLFNPALGGGALLDIGIYPAFLSLLLLGKPDRIRALAHLGNTGIDEDIGVILQYADGRLAHLHATFLARTKTEAFIYGEDATIHIHTRWHESSSLSVLRGGQRPQDYHYTLNGNGYYLEAEEVMKCLGEGRKESPLLPLSFSRNLIELLDAIRAEAGINYPGS